jgi:pectinesterase
MTAQQARAAPTTIHLKPDGTGDFKTVQAAVDSLAAGSTDRVTIRLAPGSYKGKLTIGKDRPPITIVGTGGRPDDTVLTNDWNAGHVEPPSTQPVGTSGSASTTIAANDFAAENVTFENAAGDRGQAVALKITGDRGVFRNCRFLGWQDTLYPDAGRQLFEKCHIEGRTDFIFGGATAVFDRCTIRSKNGGWVTAARTLPEQKFGFVFLDCDLIGEGAPAFLGRPWQYDRGRMAAVAFIRCKMGPHVRPEGWHPWHADRNLEPGKTSRYSEFESRDADGKPLDVSKRVTWSKQLTADEARGYTVENILSGADGWKP